MTDLRTVRANGLDIAYVTEGHGPPMLLLHGATSMGTHDWGAQRPVLRSHRTLYMPDARGHARTVWDVRRSWSASQLVDDAIAFADALGLDRFHLMGLSMGARTALHLACRAPERVLSFVAISVGNAAQPAASVARRLLDPDRLERDEPAWAAELAKRHDPYQGAGGWRRLTAAIREDLQAISVLGPSELSRARMPALLACGDRDPWVRPEQAIELRHALPSASLLIVPDCGHVVVAERPSILNPALAAFVRRTQPLS